MKNQFADHVAGLSDRQLLRMFAERQDYVPEAMWAAELEVGRREIPAEVVEQAKAHGLKAAAEAQEKSEIPLGLRWKILYFVLSPLALTPVVAFLYRHHAERDYTRRSTESLEMTFLGLLFYMAVYGVLLRFWHPMQDWLQSVASSL